MSDSGREPSAAINGSEPQRPGELAVARTISDSASLPEILLARRRLIGGIILALHQGTNLENERAMRSAYLHVAMEDAETLDALDQYLTERTEQ